MAIKTNVQESVGKRAQQFILFVREVRSIASSIVDEIAIGSIRAVRVVQLQNALAQVKMNIVSWPLGSLTDAAVKARLVQEYPSAYANVAAVTSEIQSANTAFGELSAEIELLLVVARAAGNFYDSDPVTGLETFMVLSSPETDSLSAKAVSVRNSIDP